MRARMAAAGDRCRPPGGAPRDAAGAAAAAGEARNRRGGVSYATGPAWRRGRAALDALASLFG